MSTITLPRLDAMTAPHLAVALRALVQGRLWEVTPTRGRWPAYVTAAADADAARRHGISLYCVRDAVVDDWPAELVTTLAPPTRAELDAVAMDLDPVTRQETDVVCCADAADYMATYLEIEEGR
jgi:hypothetical protein